MSSLRLPIDVSGGAADKLLCVPKLVNGNGRTIADAVKCTVDDWKVEDGVKAACFDTTASNTGKHSGACHLLKELLQKTLLLSALPTHPGNNY